MFVFKLNINILNEIYKELVFENGELRENSARGYKSSFSACSFCFKNL